MERWRLLPHDNPQGGPDEQLQGEIGTTGILLTLDGQLAHMKDHIRTLRGNARINYREWMETMAERRSALAGRTLTEQDIQRMVWMGCRLAGATPANMIGPKDEAGVWITHNEDQGQQVRAIHDLAETLRQEMLSWEFPETERSDPEETPSGET